jgi:penicillin-binding protein 1A
MRSAHQGVPVASLPKSQPGNPFANLMQAASQVSPPSPSYTPSPSAYPQPVPSQAPMPPVPLPSGGGYRPPQPVRTSAPPNPNARPEAAAGLDGWLTDRLFGGSR